MKEVISARVDFPIRNDFFEVMQNSMYTNFRIRISKFQTVGWWIDEFGAATSLLWIAVFFVLQSDKLLASASLEIKPPIRVAILCASILPTLLRFLGWNLYRWHGTAAFTAFIAHRLLIENLTAVGDDACVEQRRRKGPSPHYAPQACGCGASH